MRDEKNSAAINYLPSLLVVGVALASWKLLGGPEYIDGLSSKDLLDEYDYVIGETSRHDILSYVHVPYTYRARTCISMNVYLFSGWRNKWRRHRQQTG